MKKPLELIEADVVIVLEHQMELGTPSGSGRIIPFWECDLSANDLEEIARREALLFNEHMGYGSVSWETVDSRDPSEVSLKSVA